MRAIRAVDRYRRALRTSKDYCDPVLDSMCASRFAVLRAVRPHEICGWVLSDLLRGGEWWLVDEARERVIQPDDGFATWICRPDEFWIAVGTVVPIDDAILRDAASRMTFLSTAEELADHPGLVRGIYRAAIGLRAWDPAMPAPVMPPQGAARIDAVQHRT